MERFYKIVFDACNLKNFFISSMRRLNKLNNTDIHTVIITSNDSFKTPVHIIPSLHCMFNLLDSYILNSGYN